VIENWSSDLALGPLADQPRLKRIAKGISFFEETDRSAIVSRQTATETPYW
jgi:hypothetical protein